MPVEQLGPTTLSVSPLYWDGKGLGDPIADQMWTQFPHALQQIALAELAAGNVPRYILRNDDRGSWYSPLHHPQIPQPL
ncbi:hypothetical protein [Pseudomonas subflava]|uniref:hypothetical protein n=1 Tax=Pseudomonas subflava TaxID=2952933 RepID=UPI00207922BF|nr:hypothetical protein [Pseudomonas subflava]